MVPRSFSLHGYLQIVVVSSRPRRYQILFIAHGFLYIFAVQAKKTRLINHICNKFVVDLGIYTIIARHPGIKSIHKPTMIFRVKIFRLRKVKAERSNNLTMLLEFESLLTKQGFNNIKHSLISTSCRKLRLAHTHQAFSKLIASRALSSIF